MYDSPNLRLTAGEIERYRQDGFLVIDGVLGSDWIQRLRSACESALVREKAAELGSANAFHLPEIALVHPDFMDTAKHPAIVERLKSLIGENIQLHHSKMATKPSSSASGVRWHQDAPYIPHTNSDLLTVMVMLDDATPENGCMQMAKGSHKCGAYTDLSGSFYSAPDSDIPAQFQNLEVVNIEPKAGGISIHSSLTLHSSPANLSGKPRRGIAFQYRADDCYQLAGFVTRETGILVAGSHQFRVRCDASIINVPMKIRQPQPLTPSPDSKLTENAWHQEGEFAKIR